MNFELGRRAESQLAPLPEDEDEPPVDPPPPLPPPEEGVLGALLSVELVADPDEAESPAAASPLFFLSSLMALVSRSVTWFSVRGLPLEEL
jgi:hypothetical protein